MKTGPNAFSRCAPMVIRIVRSHPRLFMAALLGLLVIAVDPARAARASARLLLGWDIAVAFYLLAVYTMVARADLRSLRERAALEDEGRLILLVLTVGAALASLGAIIAELGAMHHAGGGAALHLALATSTIALSWAFIHTMFALHYAHEFYNEQRGRGGGLRFPGGGEPDYWDFVYFSFVIGMTSQVSDVAVTDRRIRRIVTAHGAVSFVFNAALLALTVNIAANAI
jgi:uncharacterized membrane protein